LARGCLWLFGMRRPAQPGRREGRTGNEASRHVEHEIAQALASSTFLPKIARNNMLPRMCSQLACMNVAVNQLTPDGSGEWQSPFTLHG
jgi:hypothetical protein